jgi:DNA-binding response OmpR family regulator
MVEDDPTIVRALRPALIANGYEVTAVRTVRAGIEHLASQSWDVVVLDLGLPDADGTEVLKYLASSSATPVGVISARNTLQDRRSALDEGAIFYLHKPFRTSELIQKLAAALRGAESTTVDG